MYINSGIYLQDLQGGFMCEGGIFSGGFMENCQDSDLDLGVTKKDKGLSAKSPLHPLPLCTISGRGGGGPGGPNRRRLKRSPARPWWGKGRGCRGDQAWVLT
jgi:hypothetical protein